MRLYPWYQFSRNLLFWFPVFFLYMSSVVSIADVLLLEAIYYLAVVVFEAPSGYFSDRLGRRLTLLIGTAATFIGCLLFVGFSSFLPFVAGQVLFAVGMAFNSGTDSSLLYESLLAEGRGQQFASHESRAQTLGFVALAVAALSGGAVAGFDLRIAYLMSAAGALAALIFVLRFREPPDLERTQNAPLLQVREAVGLLRDPVLAWLMLFAVLLIVLIHVPYEFLQPYIAFLELDAALGSSLNAAPAISGFMAAAIMVLAASASLVAAPLGRRLGLPTLLLLAIGVEVVVIATMASVLSVLALAVIAFRSVPNALTRPLIHAAMHPRLPSALRATYISLQSLAGRLAFSFTLAIASASVSGSEQLEPDAMVLILMTYLVATCLLLPVLVYGAAFLRRRLDADVTPG